MQVHVHSGDLPDGLSLGNFVAIDTETMGLRIGRDRLCLVQLCGVDKAPHIVQLDRTTYWAPNLKALLENSNILKCFHYARFDMAVLQNDLGVSVRSVYCTKIASKLARTYTDRHGLRDLCKDLLGVDISKQQQCSDWGASHLTDAQINYAACDTIYLYALKKELDEILLRERRMELAQMCFECLPARVQLDLMGWEGEDIFAH